MSRNPYIREVPRFMWIFDSRRYLRYMARELTCLFVGGYVLMLVVGIRRLSQGQAAYEAFLDALKSPASVIFHFLALCFCVYHSATWFNLTPKALPLQIGEEFIPGWVIAGLHYLIWLLFSAAVIFLAGAF